MENLQHMIKSYADFGDPECMDKVKNYLDAQIDLNNISPEKIKSLPLLKIVQDIGLHITLDILRAKNPEEQTRYVFEIIKTVFHAFYKCYWDHGQHKKAYEFVCEVEDAFYETNLFHGGLDSLIRELPFEQLKEKWEKSNEQPVKLISMTKDISFDWQKDEVCLTKLSDLLHTDYGIIKAPTRFEKLLKGNSDIQVKVNGLKIGHFIILIKELLARKFFKLKGGKGYWSLLTDIVVDFDGKKIANSKNSFKSLSSKLSKKSIQNDMIFKQIEEILNQLE